jgi:hypothetical protein
MAAAASTATSASSPAAGGAGATVRIIRDGNRQVLMIPHQATLKEIQSAILLTEEYERANPGCCLAMGIWGTPLPISYAMTGLNAKLAALQPASLGVFVSPEPTGLPPVSAVATAESPAGSPPIMPVTVVSPGIGVPFSESPVAGMRPGVISSGVGAGTGTGTSCFDSPPVTGLPPVERVEGHGLGIFASPLPSALIAPTTPVRARSPSPDAPGAPVRQVAGGAYVPVSPVRMQSLTDAPANGGAGAPAAHVGLQANPVCEAIDARLEALYGQDEVNDLDAAASDAADRILAAASRNAPRFPESLRGMVMRVDFGGRVCDAPPFPVSAPVLASSSASSSASGALPVMGLVTPPRRTTPATTDAPRRRSRYDEDDDEEEEDKKFPRV